MAPPTKKKNSKKGKAGKEADTSAEEPAGPAVAIGKKPKAGGGTPGWVTTFADLMSLLMCFFVMLCASATVEKKTYQEMVESMVNELGGQPETIENIEDLKEVLENIEVEKVPDPSAKLKEDLSKEVEAGRIEIEEDGETIKIRLLQSVTFTSGSATLKRSFKKVAKKLRATLKKTDGKITIIGHTDNRPIKSRRFRSNWELASARAVSVLNALVEKTLPSARFAVRSFGDTQPRVSNDTAKNRAKNRRITIVLNQNDTALIKPGDLDARAFIIHANNVDDVSGLQIKEHLKNLAEQAPE
ncbi:MAG: OmpA family protein [Myxococcota bacterium]|nr:OmpA family protein [Myxococcota bacterium]